MGDIAFFMLLAVVTTISFTLSESLQMRRRRMRHAFVDSQDPISDEAFTIGVSAIEPVPQGFVRAFRLSVGRAFGIDASRLHPQHRIRRDLRVVAFDTYELAGLLERAFDMRVRVLDVVRAATLRDLCKVLYPRSMEPSESEPPLHRDPVPRLRAPDGEEASVPEPTVKLDAGNHAGQ